MVWHAHRIIKKIYFGRIEMVLSLWSAYIFLYRSFNLRASMKLLFSQSVIFIAHYFNTSKCINRIRNAEITLFKIIIIIIINSSIIIPRKWILLLARTDWQAWRWLFKYIHLRASSGVWNSKNRSFFTFLSDRQSIVFATIFWTCVIHTKAIIFHIDASERGGNLLS